MIEAMKQALEALESERDKYVEWGDEDGAPEDVYEAITSLCQAIEQAEKQEPVAYQNTQEKCRIETVPAQGGLLPTMQEGKDFTITHPQPQREWVGLTDEEIAKVCGFGQFTSYSTQLTLSAVARAIEQALKEKNT